MTQQTARVFLAALAIAAFAAGCGGGSNTPAASSFATDTTTTAGGQAPPTTRAPVTATTPTTAVSPAHFAADAALALRVLPQPHDLPTGWTLVDNEAATGDNLNAPPDACDPTGLFSHQVLGWTRAWSYLLGADGNESGHLTVTVKISRNAGIVSRQLALLRSAHFQPCEAQNIEEDLTAAGARLTGTTKWSTLPLQLPVPGGAERYVTPYQFRGNNKIAYTDYIVVGVGRARIKILAQRCCVVPSAQLEDTLIAATATRLRAG